jgi:ribosomal 50S subunit-associated protein YjgA (DUF615 family)
VTQVRNTQVRNVDPAVAHHRGKLAGYTAVGDQENAALHRTELHHAKILAAAKAVAARLPELPPQKQEQVRALLAGA